MFGRCDGWLSVALGVILTALYIEASCAWCAAELGWWSLRSWV